GYASSLRVTSSGGKRRGPTSMRLPTGDQANAWGTSLSQARDRGREGSLGQRRDRGEGGHGPRSPSRGDARCRSRPDHRTTGDIHYIFGRVHKDNRPPEEQ